MGKRYTTDSINIGGHSLGATMMASLNTVVANPSNYLTTLPLTGGTLSGNLDVNADIQGNTFTQAASGIPRSNLGAPTVSEMALFDNEFTPKTTLANSYDDLTDLTFWVQTTSGSAWTEVTTYSDDQKRKFLRTNNSSVIIPNGAYKFRVEFVGRSYTFANAMYAYWSSQSHSTQVHIWKYNVANSAWTQHTSSSATVSSWPGHLYLPFSTIPWHESNTTSTGHYKSIRVEFTPNWSTGAYSGRNINLSGMQLWGGYPSGRRTVHSYDQNGKLNLYDNLNVPGDIDVAGKVGIGTTSPGNKLHVSGGEIQVVNGSSGKLLLQNSTNYVYGDQNGVGIFNANDNLRLYTVGSERMRITSGGNVGIGADSPSEKLQVYEGGLTAYKTYTDTNAGAILTAYQSTLSPFTKTTDLVAGSDSTVPSEIRFLTRTNGTSTIDERMRITSSGNVGIGTTSPSGKLEVNTGSSAAYFTRTAGDNGALNPVVAIATDSTRGLIAASGSSLDFRVRAVGTANPLGGSTMMSITSSGNVGIGTTAPGRQLELTGQGVIRLNAISSGDPGLDFNTSDVNDMQIRYRSITDALAIYSYGTSSDVLTIKKSDGNVGIGTTSPGARLDVVRNAASYAVNLGDTDARASLKLKSSSTGDGQLTVSQGGSSSQIIQGSNAAGTSAVNINMNPFGGNIGIGTTSPLEPLSINSGTNESVYDALGVYNSVTGTSALGKGTAIRIGSNSNGNYSTKIATIYEGNNPSYLQPALAFFTMNNTYLKGSETEKMRISANGNVGIGTTSPSATLDINGDIVISDSGDRVFTTTSQNGAFSLGDVDALADEAVVQGDGSFIFLKNAGNTTLTTTVNNRVGIGTNGPGSKLDIIGATTTGTSSLLRVRTTDNPNAPEKVVGFYVNTSTERGFISVNQYATAYSTSSDYRLKENIVPISNSVERLKELNPCRFNFIGADYTVDGFLAHEAAEVVPEAVTGNKDAVDEDNNPSYQGIDQSKVVPLLTAALQEAIEKIEQLEIRIQTLENN